MTAKQTFRAVPFVVVVFLVASVAMSLTSRSAWADDVVISELMAINNGEIRDEDGDTPDFVELYNAGDEDCDLDGWFLTDDPLNLQKWSFPAVTIEPGGFLVVFCSDKDRRDPGSQLHTNFKLSSLGELIALVRPDGETIQFQYAPFPQQVAGFSYGLEQNSAGVELVDSEVPCRALVPTSNIGTNWRNRIFNDGGWDSGDTGVGYERGRGYQNLIGLNVFDDMEGENTSCYIRVPFDVPADSNVTGVILRMKFDDGFHAFINGVPIAGGNSPAVGSLAWNSSATSLHDDSAAVEFVEYSASVPPGTIVPGVTNILAIHGLNDNLNSSDFIIMPELSGFTTGELDRDSRLFFPDPTPGAGNLPGVVGIALPPTIEPASGVIAFNTEVTLDSESPNGTIYYTTDGDNPTEQSRRYTGPFTVSSSTQIRARVFEDDGDVSPTVTANYIFVHSNLRNQTSTIPIVVLENFNDGRPGSGSFDGAVMAIYEPVGGQASFSTAPSLVNRIGIKTRGSSSGGRDKVSYTMEFWDEYNEDKGLEPLGMQRESDWVLYGAYNFDRAHLRNSLSYELSRQVGRWATRTRFIELYFNMNGGPLDSGDYRGIYSFMEKIKRDESRIDIEELLPGHDSEPEISGGYMLKIDRADPGDRGFSGAGRSIRYVEPKEDDIPPHQANWIRNYFNAFGNALNGANFRHPTLGYRPYVDTPSWIDHHLLNVLPKNVDALRLSTYFYKDRNGPIEFGAIWDFDRSMNSTDGRDNDPRTWRGTGDGTDYFGYPWWNRLFQDPDFTQEYRDRWYIFRTDPLSNQSELDDLPPLSNGNINAVIDRMAAEIRGGPINRDTAKWNQISASGWEGEIRNLKTWLNTRASWMDDQFRRPPGFSRRTGPIDPGDTLTLSRSTGTIYYTTDGSDPRASGGGIAGGAERFDSGDEIELEGTMKVTARIRVGTTDWSPARSETYYEELPPIVISEIMYHPEPDGVQNGFNDEDYEFVEFTNSGTEPVALGGIQVLGAIRFTFPTDGDPMLGPGEYVVIVNNLEAFAERYDVARIYIAGEYDGRLANTGERIIVRGTLDEPIHDFSYDDLWYPTTDGAGDSLVAVDLLADRDAWNTEEQWGPSSSLGGSPGGSDDGFPPLGGRQLPGDSNQDGLIDVSDAYSLIRRLFLGDAPDLPCDNDDSNDFVLDVDANGELQVTDVIYLLGYLFQGGPAPANGTDCVRLEGCPNLCRL